MDESWKQIVSDIVTSYDQLGGLNNQDVHNMPSKRAVGSICEDLLRLLFPGFHDDDAIHKHTVFDLTEERLSDVVHKLEIQVRKSVRIGDPHRPTGRTKPILLKFCKDLPEIRQLLHTDIETAYDGDPAALSREEIILSYPCIEAISIQRMAHRLYLSEVPIIPRMMTEWAHSRTGNHAQGAPRNTAKQAISEIDAQKAGDQEECVHGIPARLFPMHLTRQPGKWPVFFAQVTAIGRRVVHFSHKGRQ